MCALRAIGTRHGRANSSENFIYKFPCMMTGQEFYPFYNNNGGNDASQVQFSADLSTFFYYYAVDAETLFPHDTPCELTPTTLPCSATLTPATSMSGRAAASPTCMVTRLTAPTQGAASTAPPTTAPLQRTPLSSVGLWTVPSSMAGICQQLRLGRLSPWTTAAGTCTTLTRTTTTPRTSMSLSPQLAVVLDSRGSVSRPESIIPAQHPACKSLSLPHCALHTCFRCLRCLSR